MVAGRWKLQRASRLVGCSRDAAIVVVENVYRSYRCCRRRLRRRCGCRVRPFREGGAVQVGKVTTLCAGLKRDSYGRV